MSVVALLLYNADKIEFLKTSGFTVLQHNPFNWHVKGTSLIRIKRNSITSRYLEKSVTRFFSIMNFGDRKKFFNILFFIAKDNPKSSLLDIKRHPLRYLLGIKRRKKELSKEEFVFYKYVTKTIRISFTSTFKESVKRKKNEEEKTVVLNKVEAKGNE